MKTLLTTILILISFGLNAQDYQVSVGGVTYNRRTIMHFEGDSIWSETIDLGVELNRDEWLMKLLTDYETYCYNDSIYIQVDEWVKEEHGGKGGMPKFTTGYQVTKWIWWHEEPTFKGFIKWLKEQK